MNIRDTTALIAADGWRGHYAVVIEHAGANFSAYVPDLPGCVATGATMQETVAAIVKAINFHRDGLAEEGLPKTRVLDVNVAEAELLGCPTD